MQVNTIPLPVDVESRGADWPCVGEPTAVELAAIEAELASALSVQVGPYELADMSIGELVELAAAGSMEAFGPLFERFAPEMVRVTERRTRDHALAEDIVSEVWAQVLGMIGRWERRSASVEDDFRQLVFGLARQGVAAHFATFWREQAVADFDGHNTMVGARASLDETPADPRLVELRDKMQAGIATLCPRQRDVIKLLLDGSTQAEIATHLGLTPLQVQSAKRTAEVQLRAKLADPLDDATVAQLRDAIALLPDPHRQVTYMRMIEGLGLREIAEQTGIDYEAVRQITNRARINMRSTLVSPVANGVGDLAAARAKRERQVAQLRKDAQSLPPAQREVALLRLDGMKFREIAAALGKTHTGVDGVWRAAQNSFTRIGALADGSTIPTARVQGNPLADLDAARARRQSEIALAREAAQQLPPAQREVALLRLDGLKFSEIATALGKTKAAIQSAWRAGQTSLARQASDTQTTRTRRAA